MRYSVQRVSTCVAFLALLFGPATWARAEMLFNNFGPGDTYRTNEGWIIGQFPGSNETYVQGDAFTVRGGSFTLDTISIALAHAFGPNVVDVWFMSDAGGRPGSILESFRVTNLGRFSDPNPPVLLRSTLNPFLDEGSQYWVVASASSASLIAWNINSTGDQGPHAFSLNGGPFQTSNTDRGAFRVTGDPAVPEPATVTLLGIGALGMLGYGWRRRKQAA